MTDATPAPVTAPGHEYTVEAVIREFKTRYLRQERKRPEYAEAILDRTVLPEWKGRDIRSIKAREVVTLLDTVVDRGAKVMANRTAAIIGQLFMFAIKRGLLDDSPMKLLYRPGGKEKSRERVLSDDELRAFLSDPRKFTRFERLERIIKILLLTGQRRGELAAAKWVDVNLKAKTWRIPDEVSKTGRGHVVPLSDWAVEEFEALKREGEGSPFVLPSKPGATTALDAHALTRSMGKCRERFKEHGIADFTLHDLRRTCRTGLAKLKVPPHIAERVLNHTQEKIPGTYDVHDYMDEKRDALNKWAKHLRNLFT